MKTSKRPRFTRREMRNMAVGLLFISPWVIGFFGLLVYPLFYTLYLSFTQYTGFGTPRWIGLANYQNLMGDTLFWQSVWNTFYYTAFAVPIGIVVGMVLALAMNQPLREIPFVRAVLYLPSVLPLFTVAFMFMVLMHPTRGLSNQFLILLGLPPINWFGDPQYAKLGLVLLAQLGAGGTALIFLAGLKAIPATLYEASAIDGADPLKQFWYITLPLMTPVLLFALILGLSAGLQVFAQAYIITGGGPVGTTTFYVYYLFLHTFRYGQLGVAAAMSWILFVISVILALLIFRWSRRWVFYGTS